MRNPYRINVIIEKSTRNDLKAWCSKNHQQMGWTINNLIQQFLIDKENERGKDNE
jgi:hypothetical protein